LKVIISLLKPHSLWIFDFLHFNQDHSEVRILVVVLDQVEEVLVLLVCSEDDFVLVSLDSKADQNTAVLSIQTKLQNTLVVGSGEVVVPKTIDREGGVVGEDFIIINPEVLTFSLVRSYVNSVFLSPGFFESFC
jgi:hypothetical protein